jgi:hypothetical protein
VNSSYPSKGRFQRWTPDEDACLRELYASHTRIQIAEVLGRREPQVRSRCCTLGLNSKVKPWTAEEEAELRALYEGGTTATFDGGLKALAKRMGRNSPNLVRKAISLGLQTSLTRPKKPVEKRVPPKQRLTANDEELRALTSARMREHHATKGHPRGMLGKRHTEENKAAQSIRSKKAWESMTQEQLLQRVIKQQRTRVANGNINERKNTTWKSAWREIGGVRKYYRSRWEANYGRYLEWLKSLGKVAAWQHEPETFWFVGIRRGVCSFLPDFRVEYPDGRVEYHEVKGWMDDKSKTKIRRMAKYHPGTVLVVIDAKAYGKLAKAVGGLIGGWE